MVTVLLRETNDVAGDDDAPAPRLLETLPAAWADAVAIQSPAMAAVEGAAEATWAVFVVSGGSVLGFWRRNGREVRVEVEVKDGKKKKTGRRRFSSSLLALPRRSRVQFSTF
jgi:hypothetical protein